MTISETSGIPPVPVGTDENLTTRLWQRAKAGRQDEIVRFWAGRWRGLTWGQLAERVRDVAAGLIALGVDPGDRVALMSATRVEWTVADLAILSVGAATVPIYETSSVEQCGWILSDSGAKAAIAGSAENAKVLEAARALAPDLGEIFVIDDGGLVALAQRAGADERAQVEGRAASTTGDDTFSIIYTSGTTGNPKGCVLTHANMLFAARQSEVNLRTLLAEDDATLLFLPLAHVFARLVQFLCLEADVQLGYARSVEALPEDLVAFRPTFLLSVPRVFEKIFNGAQRKAEGPKRRVFDFAVSTATAWSTARDAGRAPSPIVQVQHRVADALVYRKLRDAFGGRLRTCVSGGAPLSPHLAHFFAAAGITILEGYGLTETSAPATCATPTDVRIGTVGRPLPGVEIRTDDDGEILIRGGNVFAGYFGDDEATAAVLDDDGWFRSGDLGTIDEDGFLRITGRKKEIIVTAAGKNVAPAVLEERLKAHRLVSQAMVVGDRRPYVAALVTLDAEELAAFAREHDLAGDAVALTTSPVVEAEVQRAVDAANAAVSRAESIRRFAILPRDFTQEGGELTPTLKVRRAAVAEHFAEDIERLYAS